MDTRYRITGGTPLRGEITISGSKNAALPLIAASLLCEGETVLHNVPDLSDVRTMLRILDFLGAKTDFANGAVRIDARHAESKEIQSDLVGKLRGSIVLLGPLLARFGVVRMAYPGGCVLGKRPVEAHISAFEQMGVENMSTDEFIHLQGTLKPGRVILPEFSVTATENVILAAARLPGETRIDLAAGEPHVQVVERFVAACGAEVTGIGSHQVIIKGRKNLQCIKERVISDYLEAGGFVIAALVTGGKLTLHDVEEEHLLSFLAAVKRLGGKFEYQGSSTALPSSELRTGTAGGTLQIDGAGSNLVATRIQTNIFPGFPTDLQAPFGVAMTQAQGVSRIFECLYEGRMAYLFELEKMGAHVEILNSHQALIIGPTPLRGRAVASNDIRAGAAMVYAALAAEGETIISDVRYIERGYDRLEEKLRSVGANIEKIE
ncbi:MAG TPA: UDP-N-acetylglucosamine 1-carboxyvinyltransferase [Candidatus Peribacteraceae bacterium]|nr:UDP-N-acetylglucosamine 1-carboxyvinyltransferase [Candidatus Peribacteraceae bacterium]